MTSKSIYTAFIAITLLFSCNDSKKNSEDLAIPETDMHNSMNSLDWEGTYEGLLPCADCEGIKTVVTLNKDNTYVIKELYVGKDMKPQESKGTFKWDDKGQKILFSDKNRPPYFVGENTLTHLDKDGTKISGDLEKHYILMKVNDQLVGKKWHLVSFKDQEIQLKQAKAEHPFIEFKDDMSVTGFTGCNNFRGTYTLMDAQKLEFSKMASTKMFCPEMETENEFLRTLTNAVHYAFVDHDLVIHDAEHKTLATFKIANEE